MKLLNGRELAGYIKERQAKQVRALIQAHHVTPKLVILKLVDNPVIDTYVRLKQRYGKDIGVEVEKIDVPQTEAVEQINKLNDDDSVHGIIVQLPIENPAETNTVLNAVALEKDVDGLAENSAYEPATPTAIMWLLAGYNVDLRGKKFAVVGKGLLVGTPLIEMLKSSGYNVAEVNSDTENMEQILQESDIVITATGVAGLITSEMVTPGTIVIDAGVAVQDGKTVGDVDEELYTRDDIGAITPKKGGVGPLTVSALFENVIKSAQDKVNDD